MNNETLITISDTITATAEQCAEALIGQGWDGTGEEYDLGCFPVDEDALREALGRPTTLDERKRLESAIRERLDVADHADCEHDYRGHMTA
mgnify:CR=1 FL=1